MERKRKREREKERCKRREMGKISGLTGEIHLPEIVAV